MRSRLGSCTDRRTAQTHTQTRMDTRTLTFSLSFQAVDANSVSTKRVRKLANVELSGSETHTRIDHINADNSRTGRVLRSRTIR